MGVLNVTPDSFSDGGRYVDLAAAVGRAHELAEAGADIIDIGGESTRPGAAPVTAADEMGRVLPVIEAVSAALDCIISIDTSKPDVMRNAVAAGAGLINDTRALREPGALEAARDCGVPVCLMHMRGEPRTMQVEPTYRDVTAEVRDFLMQRIDACRAAGLPRGRILVDPGFGFGKTIDHNLDLLAHLDRFTALAPVVVGLSRKSMLGRITGRPVAERLAPSVAAALIAIDRGASIVRVHDVAATVDAIAVYQAVQRRGSVH